MIIDIVSESPITESIYLTVLIGCFTVRLPRCVELRQADHKPYFLKQLEQTVCCISPYYCWCVFLALSILILYNYSMLEVK